MPLTVPAYFLATATNRLIGANAGSQQTGNGVFFGQTGAGDNNTGSNVVGLGVNAARGNTGTDIIVIGNDNIQSTGASANGSIIIGHRILANLANPGILDSSVIIGTDAMGNMIPTGGIGESVVIGTRAMRGGTVGAVGGTNPNRMVVIGFEAGEFSNRDGASTDENTLIGWRAGRGNAVAGNSILNCTFVGAGAGVGVQGGSNATGVGNGALGGTLSGTGNTGVGFQAGDSISTGTNNVVIGATADCGSTSTNNVVVGAAANPSPGASNGNTVVGAAAGFASGTAGGCILIGRGAGSDVAATPNTFHLEAILSGGTPTRFLYGELGNGNLMLGSSGGSRSFGTGGPVNNFKLEAGVIGATGPSGGVSLVAIDNAGTFELWAVGPTSTALVVGGL